MGFFNKVGRTVERFKQSAQQATEESTDYQCQVCDARFDTSHDQCPECGAEDVRPTNRR